MDIRRITLRLHTNRIGMNFLHPNDNLYSPVHTVGAIDRLSRSQKRNDNSHETKLTRQIANNNKKKKKRTMVSESTSSSVRFSTVEIREYPTGIILGTNPSTVHFDLVNELLVFKWPFNVDPFGVMYHYKWMIP